MRAALILSFASGVVACGGEAGDARGIDPPPTAPAIYGGEPTAACGWPMTVYLAGCTGTLVHPELVLLAAHCVPLEPESALFGDDYTDPQITAAIASCAAHPQSKELGNDIGFCRLAEPLDGIPIVPLLAGCETAALVPGAEVVAVGFGEADDTLGPGPKRQVSLPIVAVSERDAEIGGNGKDTCTGDSGGPVFIQLGDGTWRIFAVTSYGNTCGEGGHYSLLHPAQGWLEQASGLDLTPCHDGAEWAPTERCGAFPLHPELGGGSWAAGCASDDVSGYGESCGGPYDPNAPPPAEMPEARGGCALARAGSTGAPHLACWIVLALARRMRRSSRR